MNQFSRDVRRKELVRRYRNLTLAWIGFVILTYVVVAVLPILLL